MPRRPASLAGWWAWPLLALAAALVPLTAAVTVGADTMWMVALGNAVARTGAVPAGIPFAAAGSGGWPAVPAGGGLLLAAVHHLGPLGLPAAQLAVDAAVLLLVALGARRLGAGGGPTAIVLALAVLALLPTLGVVRAQLLSLVPFAVLTILLRAEHARPSRRVWWLVPLVAAWGNLHGAVLVGVVVAACSLLLSRARRDPWTAAGVLVALPAALFLNPAGLRTPAYYLGVLGNEAARRGSQLWAPPRLDSGFDLLLIVAGTTLLALAVVARRPAWEYVVLAGLAVETTTAARYGTWLVLFAGAAAAAGLTGVVDRRTGARRPRRLLRVTGLVLAVALAGLAGGLLASRAPAFATDDDVARAVARAADGRTVLAPEPLAESLAAAGARVWLSNPIDAFSRTDQAAYLDFLAGGGPLAGRALAAADVVVVEVGSPPAGLAERAGFRPVRRIGRFDVETRPPGGRPPGAARPGTSASTP